MSQYKYLGVVLDPHLTFRLHAEHISKKCKQRVSMLWRMRNFISENLALSLYNSLIKPVFTYCDFVYDGCGKAVSKQLQVMQNSALRAMKGINGRYSATALHLDLHVPWLDVTRKNSALKRTNCWKERAPVD